MTRLVAKSPRVVVLGGFGLNGEDELERAFASVGATPARVLVSDFIARPQEVLDEAALFAIPGGFSFGDDTGGGNGLAQLMQAQAREALVAFSESGGLILGICNGCQTLVRMGLVGVPRGAVRQQVAVVENASSTYEARFVRLVPAPNSVADFWFAGADSYDLSVAHGEGRFITRDQKSAQALLDSGLVALRYANPDANGSGGLARGAYPANPNGSVLDIAAVSDTSGRVLAMMPHPERSLVPAHHPTWQRLADSARRAGGGEIPRFTSAQQIFANAVARAQENFCS